MCKEKSMDVEDEPKDKTMDVEGTTSESEDEGEPIIEDEPFGAPYEGSEGEEDYGLLLDETFEVEPVEEESSKLEETASKKRAREAEQPRKKAVTIDDCIEEMLVENKDGKAETGIASGVATCPLKERQECKVTDVHVVGRPARSHGESMGDHTTPFSIVMAIVANKVTGKTVDEALKGLRDLYEKTKELPGYKCEWTAEAQQKRFKEEEKKLQEALKTVDTSTSCQCMLANLQLAIGRFLEYREMIPLSTLNIRWASDAGGKGKGESRSLGEFQYAQENDTYWEDSAYTWFDQAAVALWAAATPDERKVVSPWKRPVDPPEKDEHGAPVCEPITQEHFFEQHCKTLPTLGGVSLNSTTMGALFEDQLDASIMRQTANVNDDMKQVRMNHERSQDLGFTKPDAENALRAAYLCEKVGKRTKDMIDTVKPMLELRAKRSAADLANYKSTLGDEKLSAQERKELRRLEEEKDGWASDLESVTGHGATVKSALADVDGAAHAAALAAQKRGRSDDPEAVEAMKKEQRRIAYGEGLPEEQRKAKASKGKKSQKQQEEEQAELLRQEVAAAKLEEAANPFGDSTLGIQLGKKDDDLHPFLTGLAVQVNLEQCLTVSDIRFGGRPMSPFNGTMGSHHIAWVLMCDNVRRKITGKKLGSKDLCDTLEELTNLPDTFRAKFAPTKKVKRTQDQLDEDAIREGKESNLLRGMTAAAEAKTAKEGADSDGKEEAEKSKKAKLKLTESDQKTKLQKLASASESCKSVEGLQLFLSTLMSLINLVPGVSVNETMPDGKGEGTARRLLRQYEDLVISYRRLLSQKISVTDHSGLRVRKIRLEANRSQREKITAEQLAAAVQKLVDAKANKYARTAINQLVVSFVQDVYPNCYHECSGQLAAWIADTEAAQNA